MALQPRDDPFCRPTPSLISRLLLCVLALFQGCRTGCCNLRVAVRLRRTHPNGANEFIVARERQPPDHLHVAGSHDGYSAVMDRVLLGGFSKQHGSSRDFRRLSGCYRTSLGWMVGRAATTSTS